MCNVQQATSRQHPTCNLQHVLFLADDYRYCQAVRNASGMRGKLFCHRAAHFLAKICTCCRHDESERERARGGGGQQACWHGIPIRTAAAFMHPRCVQLEMEAGAQHPQIIAYFAANILPHHCCYSQQLFTYLMQINSWKFFGKYVSVSFKTRFKYCFFHLSNCAPNSVVSAG